MEKEKMYLVPESWLKGLRELAEKAEAAIEETDVSYERVKTTITSSMLIGYAKSAGTVLKHNEYVEK